MPQPDDLPAERSQVRRNLQALDAVLNDAIAGADGCHSRKLIFQIERLLRQFCLESFYDESDILIEAYLRTYLRIEQGTSIKNLPAWLYKVSHNIIREYSRLDIRNRKLLVNNTRHFEISQLDSNRPAFITEQTIALLVTSLYQLKDEDRQILQLRVGLGLSWKKVKENWNQMHQVDIAESTLRKKGERALERLRLAFHSNHNNTTV